MGLAAASSVKDSWSSSVTGEVTDSTPDPENVAPAALLARMVPSWLLSAEVEESSWARVFRSCC